MSEFHAALIGAATTILAAALGLLPFWLERRKRNTQKYKMIYVKIIHLRLRETGSTPVYRTLLHRTNREVDVFDEYHFFRLNVFHKEQKEFRCTDRTSGVVDLQVIHPWQEHLVFADRDAASQADYVEQTVAAKSDLYLTKSVYYNALQDGHEDVGMKLEHDTDEARIFIDFSSLADYDRILLSTPKARRRDIQGVESTVGVAELFGGLYTAELKDAKKGEVLRLDFKVSWKSVCVFGYGSLINKSSAARALEEPEDRVVMIPAQLQGFRRTWSLRESVFSHNLDKVVEAAFLDVEETSSASINGVLLPVSDEQLQKLIHRERNYELVDVTDRVFGAQTVAGSRPRKVLVFRGKTEFKINRPTEELFVLENYTKLVREGCEQQGQAFCEAFDRTTEKPGGAILPGQYTFLDTVQATYV